MLKKFTKTLLTAVMLAGSVATPVFAEGVTYTPVAGGEININKYLVMEEAANVPNVEFTFTIAAGTASNSDAGTTKAQVRAGNDANAVTGTPTITTATFETDQATYASVQDLASAGLKVAPNAKDPVTLAQGEKYAKSLFKVNFSGVTFKEPGVYRYVITESATTSGGITNDTDADRILDVYVIDEDGALQVQGYVLHNNDGDVMLDGTSADNKAEGFVNKYSTHDLTISKTVAGNAGSRDEYFKFTVAIEGAVPGTKYNVDLSAADAQTKTNAINTEAHTNPATLTVGEDGKIQQDFYLQNGQNIKIKGLADGTKYTVSEEDALLDNEGYVTTVEQTGDTDGEFTADSRSLVNAAITADTTDAFTNTKNETIPTGIINKVAPYAAVVGLAAFLLIVSRRKHTEVQ